MRLIEIFDDKSVLHSMLVMDYPSTDGNTGDYRIFSNCVESTSNNELELPSYLKDNYEFWMYNEKLANAFDKKFDRHNDNPIVNRGLNEFTLDWILSNKNTTTSYYNKDLPLDPKKLVNILGMNKEHTYMSKPEHQKMISSLADTMRTNGYDHKYPVFIAVTINGPRVVEGNHRIRAAIEAELRVIPVEWRWWGGTEMNKQHHPVRYINPL